MSERACRKCHSLTYSRPCPNCGSDDLSDDWSGLVIIFDPETSKVARRLGITKPGRYAIVVR